MDVPALLLVLAFGMPVPRCSPSRHDREGLTKAHITHVVCDRPHCLNVRHVAWGGPLTNWLESMVHRHGVEGERNPMRCMVLRDGFKIKKPFVKTVHRLR